MEANQYHVETLTGQPVYTDGRHVTLIDTGKRATVLGMDLNECQAIFDKRLGQPVRFIKTGKMIQYMSI